MLRRFAVQPRTAFSGAPCLKLSEDGYNPDEQTAFPFKIGEIERVSMPKSSVPIGKTGQATSPKWRKLISLYALVEVADFIIKSVEGILCSRLDSSLQNEGEHIFDLFNRDGNLHYPIAVKRRHSCYTAAGKIPKRNPRQ